MSNRIYIERIEERTVDSDRPVSGVHIFDDYDNIRLFDDSIGAMPVETTPDTDKQLLMYVFNHLDDADGLKDFFAYVTENAKDLHIDDTYYEYTEWHPWIE